MKSLGNLVAVIARVTAISGGVVLVALVLTTVVSIVGRAMITLSTAGGSAGDIGSFLVGLGAGPVPGDYELIEAGTAFAVFSFLPWCHLNRGNAAVEILAPVYGNRGNRIIDVAADLLMFAVAILIGWRHWLGTVDKYNYGETTFILQFPVWWGYAASLPGAAVFVIVTAWCLARSVADLGSSRPWQAPGAMH